MIRSPRLFALVAMTLLVPLAAGCQPDTGPGSPDSGTGAGAPAQTPFAGCAGLTAVPPGTGSPVSASATPAAGAGTRSAGEGTRSAGAASSADREQGRGQPAVEVRSTLAPSGGRAGSLPLPDLALSCYSDGTRVELSSLRGPAVVNMWASWCAPCRRELPVLRDFAGRNAGRLHVVGVVSTDARATSLALAQELNLTFPHLFDEDGELLRRLGRAALPVTLFIDAEGRISSLYAARALDRKTLDRLVSQHLGVVPA